MIYFWHSEIAFCVRLIGAEGIDLGEKAWR
jgi:hypothetical protein